jgi:Uma2 family endonuclease
MYAFVSSEKIQLLPGTVVRMPGSWQTYRTLCDGREDSSIPRIKYRNGEILLMSPLPIHGRNTNLIANVVIALLDSINQNYEAFTPITMELPEEVGIEPDYCFYIDNWQAVVGKDRINWQSDPPPDLVLEIDVTSYTDVGDYLPYAVPEVWLFKNNRLCISALESGQYQIKNASRYFPEIDLQELVRQCLETASQQGTGTAIRDLRASLAKSQNLD